VNKIFLYISILSIFSACELFQKKSVEKDSKLIAKVEGFKLYEQDLRLVFPENIASTDSAEVATNLIVSWAKKKLLLKKAEVNMPSHNKELEALVSRYREDLYIDSFKRALLAKELDTVVSNEEVVAYYKNNKASFKINEELVKFMYIAMDTKHKKRTAFRRLFLSKSKNDLFILDEQSNDMESSFLSDSLWIRYKDVQRKLPFLNDYDTKTVLRPNKFIAKTYDGNIYYVYIKEVVNRNEIAPLRYVRKTIEQMVLQQRKLQLIHKVEEVLFDDATKNKQLEIY
jgi:hypothetical protein